MCIFSRAKQDDPPFPPPAHPPISATQKTTKSTLQQLDLESRALASPARLSCQHRCHKRRSRTPHNHNSSLHRTRVPILNSYCSCHGGRRYVSDRRRSAAALVMRMSAAAALMGERGRGRCAARGRSMRLKFARAVHPR